MTSATLPPTTGPAGSAEARGTWTGDVAEAASAGDAAARSDELVGGAASLSGELVGAATTPQQTTADVVRVLGRVRAPLAAVAGAPLWQLPVPALVAALEAQAQVDAAATATRAALVAAADERGLQTLTGAPSLERYLTQRLRLSRAEANAWVRDAHTLRAAPEARDALAAATVTSEQGRVIAAALSALPPVREPVRAAAADLLVEQAGVLDPLGLGNVARHLQETVTTAPDVDDPADAAAVQAEADAAQAAAAQSAVERARALRHLTWRRHVDGSVSGRFHLDPLGGQTLLTALGALTARHDHDPRRPDHPADCPTCAADATRDGAPLADPLSRDTRSAAQRKADALVALARLALGADGMPSRGGARPTLVVTTTTAALADQLGATGALPYAGSLDAPTLRRLACDAEILPAVLGGPSEVLDLGRTRRLFTVPQRRALGLRDRGCIHPGCERTPPECEAHHLHPGWSGGAGTDLRSGALLCDYHHDQHHRLGWQVRLARNGYPEVIPPASLDPTRTPRQHHRFHDLPART
jgi:hypothetical protein